MLSRAPLPLRTIAPLFITGGVDLGAPVASIAGAYIIAGYGGEETGHGLWNVLTGRVSPSGRLPITHYAEPYLSVVAPIADFNLVSEASGVGRTYRYVNESFVLFHFGAGLSYSAFAYSALNATILADGSLEGSVMVSNTGGVDAYEVVQVGAVARIMSYDSQRRGPPAATGLHYCAGSARTGDACSGTQVFFEGLASRHWPTSLCVIQDIVVGPADDPKGWHTGDDAGNLHALGQWAHADRPRGRATEQCCQHDFLCCWPFKLSDAAVGHSRCPSSLAVKMLTQTWNLK